MKRNIAELNLLIGQQFGKLTIIEVLPTKAFKNGKRLSFRSMLLCRCDCGSMIERTVKALKSGNTKSCGCLIGEKNRNYFTTHGSCYDPLYVIWSSMKSRCYNSKEVAFKNYGGRGIAVCDEWVNNAGLFIKWSKENGWAKGLDIDRIDNDKNYEPNNCRFVTRKVNSNNRRNSKLYSYNGQEKTLSQWCEELNLVYNTIRGRIIRGASFDKAVETPRVRYCRGGLVTLFLLSISLSSMCQEISIKQYDKINFKKYIPSLSFFFMAGAANGLRDCSLFYHIKNGGFFDGRESWKRKYKNGDYTQGEAFPLSTTLLAPFTDNVHFAPRMANHFDAWGAAMMPTDNNRRFSHLLLKVAAITATRSLSHFLVYDILIKNQNR